MKFVKTFIALVIFLINFTPFGLAQLEVPDYSFTGKEITAFAVAPGYTSVDFDFKLPSRMDVYLQKQKADLNLGDKGTYSADDPGVMYSSPSSTSFSSIFVGTKAFRNNMSKMYLAKRHIDVIQTYEKYIERIEKSEYADESKLLYGISLYETGNHKEAVLILTELAGRGGQFAEIALDKLFAIADGLRRFDIMESAAQTAPNLTPYAFGIWLKSLHARNHYDVVLSYMNKYPDYEKRYPALANLRISSLYFLQKYDEAIALADSVKNMSSYPLVVDSLVMKGQSKRAALMAQDIADDEVKNIILAKIDISKANFTAAGKRLQNIKSDSEKLALFFYAVSAKFREMPQSFLSSFNFKDKQNNDYVNFYSGLKYLGEKKNLEAVNKFALVAFNKELVKNSAFYTGMAVAPLDRARSEWSFNKYISSGDDVDKIRLAKFMVAQIYYLDKKNADALMIIDDCSADYCMRLKADIMLTEGKFLKATELVAKMEDDRSKLIRAGAYYNLKDYPKALKEIASIKKKTPDAEFILMMSLFKTNKPKEAELVLKKNVADKRVMNAGVEQLILAGMGDTALAYIDKNENIAPLYKLERAKLLQSAGRVDEAEKAFKTLVAQNANVYEAMIGLWDIAEQKKKGKEFVVESKTFMDKSPAFENKDLLTARFASYASDAGEYNVAIAYVNYFADNFKNSPHTESVRKTRANLFKFTGKYESCVKEADAIMAKGGPDGEDAMFLKAECLEFTDKVKATAVYSKMFTENGRFFRPAGIKITEISENPLEILNASKQIRKISQDAYAKGAVRFIERVTEADFEKFKEDVATMASLDGDSVRAAALWRTGKHLLDKGSHLDAAENFLKSYYLFPKEPFAIESLKYAKSAYSARGMDKEVAKLDELIKAGLQDNKTKKGAKNTATKK